MGWNKFLASFNRWRLNTITSFHIRLKLMTFVRMKGDISRHLFYKIRAWGLWILCSYLNSKNGGKWSVFSPFNVLLFIEGKKLQAAERIGAVYRDGAIAESIWIYESLRCLGGLKLKKRKMVSEVYMVGLERHVYYELLQNQTLNPSKSCSKLNWLKAVIDEKRPKLINQKGVLFNQDSVWLYIAAEAIEIGTVWLGYPTLPTIFTWTCTYRLPLPLISIHTKLS